MRRSEAPEAFEHVVHRDVGGPEAPQCRRQKQRRLPEVGAESEHEMIGVAEQRDVGEHSVHAHGVKQ